jgi:hypothetical protein
MFHASPIDASADPITCEATLCTVNQKVSSNACVACPAGKTNTIDDASGPDTACEATTWPAMLLY